MNFMELLWKCDVIQEISILVLTVFLVFFNLSHFCAITSTPPNEAPGVTRGGLCKQNFKC